MNDCEQTACTRRTENVRKHGAATKIADVLVRYPFRPSTRGNNCETFHFKISLATRNKSKNYSSYLNALNIGWTTKTTNKLKFSYRKKFSYINQTNTFHSGQPSRVGLLTSNSNTISSLTKTRRHELNQKAQTLTQLLNKSKNKVTMNELA